VNARQLDEHPEAVKQAAVADRLLISKTDIAGIDASAHLRAPEDLSPGRRSPNRAGRDRPPLLFDSGPLIRGKSDVCAWLSRGA
jgi:G3E family GTPase